MTPRIARKTVLAVVALGALLFASGCNNPVDPDAATVDGVSISRDDLFAQAEAFAVVPNSNLGADVERAFSGVGVADVLSGMIVGRIYEDAAQRAGLTVTDADIAAARSQIGSTLDLLPDDIAEDFARRTALQQIVNQHTSTEQWWTEDDIARYHEATNQQACVRHVMVTSEEEADDVLAELESGADFAELARDRSTDTASAEDGGSLGCNPRGWFIAAFDDAIEDAESGEVVGPIATGTSGQQNWHVIRVDEAYRERTLDESRDDIEALFATPAGWSQYVLRTTDVDVDPRFGTWDPATGSVTPPAGAQPGS